MYWISSFTCCWSIETSHWYTEPNARVPSLCQQELQCVLDSTVVVATTVEVIMALLPLRWFESFEWLIFAVYHRLTDLSFTLISFILTKSTNLTDLFSVSEQKTPQVGSFVGLGKYRAFWRHILKARPYLQYIYSANLNRLHLHRYTPSAPTQLPVSTVKTLKPIKQFPQ